MISKEIFSKRIKALRVSKAVTQKDLANDLGMIMQRISNWEKGVSYPSLEVADQLADYFDVSLDYLVGRSDDPARK